MQEIFGPVMQLMTFKTMDEAIERANTTHYGLAAGICTRDVAKEKNTFAHSDNSCISGRSWGFTSPGGMQFHRYDILFRYSS